MAGHATAAWSDPTEVEHGTPAGFLWERAVGKAPCALCRDAYNRDKARLQRENREHKRWLRDLLQEMATDAYPTALVIPEEIDALWSVLGRHLLSRNFEMAWWHSRNYDLKGHKQWKTRLLLKALSNAQIDRAEYVYCQNLTYKLSDSTKWGILSGIPAALESAHLRWQHGNNVHGPMLSVMPLGYLDQRRRNQAASLVCTIQEAPRTLGSSPTIGGVTSQKALRISMASSGGTGTPTKSRTGESTRPGPETPETTPSP